MNIYKVNEKLSALEKIKMINDMVKELEGALEQGKFDLNELDQLISVLGIDRKFLRNESLGHTILDYTDWSHLKTEDGLSIWKLSPTNYKYNAKNKLYFDDKLLENRGEADSESATSFDKAYLYDDEAGSGEDPYIDNTAEAGTEGGTEFELMDSISDYLYLSNGILSTFAGIKFEFHTRGSGYALKIEYYDETSGVNDWVELTINTHNLDDDTSGFESDGKITWDIPAGWGTNAVNGIAGYWIRISTTVAPTKVAKAHYIIPGDSVISLLALSSTQFFNEDWAWCSYGSSIYATIRNEGEAAYEGNQFITSTSSAINLKNFFIYNHEYKADYEDSTYDPVKTITSNDDLDVNEGIVLIDASSSSVIATLPSASEIEGKQFLIKVLDIGSGLSASVDTQSGETIDGSSTYNFGDDYEAITVVSDGTNWFIVGKV